STDITNEDISGNDEDVKVRSIDEVLNDGKQPAEPQPQIVQSGASSAGGAKVDTRGNAMQKSVRRMVWNDSPQQEAIQVGQNGGMLNAITGQYMPYSMTQEGQASKNAMLANALSGANLGGGNSAYSMQNDQAGKQAFLNANAGKSGMTQHNLATLYTGTIVPLVLETGINTDLPGVVIARATKNIYSSFDGRYLIIPEGTRFFATYNSSISYHQNRVQVVWNTMIRPDGLEVNLGNMNGVDMTGMSGYKGFVNEHPFEYAKAIGLIAGFSILTTGFTVINSNLANNLYAQNAVAATGQQLSNIADDLINRALNIQPTITVKNGVEVDLITNVPLNLPPLEIPAVNEKYVRY
ncbi:MAG: TrbI/VirB10 family protein, partial [Clostridia bacterium]|nr:TrbI/VirB10 family protein [Clostridia bacterium]